LQPSALLPAIVLPINQPKKNSMKKFISIVLVLIAMASKAQLVSYTPLNADFENNITIQFNLNLSKGEKTTGLLGVTDGLYLWAGAGTTATNAFEYSPKEQYNFNASVKGGKLTSLGGNRWQITLLPRIYFGVPADKKILVLGLIVKNAAGTAQTEAIVLQQGNTAFLNEVVIIAKKPFIEQQIDKTVVNVQADINAIGSTAFEILQKAPGISITGDDNINMSGKAGVNVLIDGRPTQMSSKELANFLRGMPGSTIDKIELITNPSARFDAQGNAGIINIRLKKNKLKGTNGNITTGYTQQKHYRSNGSIKIRESSANTRNKRIGDKELYNGQGFMNILNNLSINECKSAMTSDKPDNEARDKILAFFRVCFDREIVMRRLIELLYGLCGDSQAMSEFRVEDGRLFIDTAPLKKLVEDLFADVSYFMDSLRPFVSQECMDKYTGKINPGSYYWLQEQLMEKLIKGRPPQAGVAEAKKGYINIDEACRKLSNTYNILTLKYNHDLTNIQNGVLGTKVLSCTNYDKVFAEILFYNAAIANSDIAVSEESPNYDDDGVATDPPKLVNYKTNPYEAFHISGYAGLRSIDTRFIARFKQLYTFTDEITMNKSLMFSFNQLIAKYIHQFYDVATQKIYINTINNFVNGAFNQPTTDFMYTYPDISPRVFSKYEDDTTRKIDSRDLMRDATSSLDPDGLLFITNVVDKYELLFGSLDNLSLNQIEKFNDTDMFTYSLINLAYFEFIKAYTLDNPNYKLFAPDKSEIDVNDNNLIKEIILSKVYTINDTYNTLTDYGDLYKPFSKIFHLLFTKTAKVGLPYTVFEGIYQSSDNQNKRKDLFIYGLLRVSQLVSTPDDRIDNPEDVRKVLRDELYKVPTIFRKAGEPIVDVVVKYDDIITADETGNNMYGSKTSGLIRKPQPGAELNKLKVGGKTPSVPNDQFGQRRDPDGNHVLFTSLSVILKNMITIKNPINQQLVHLTETISDVPLYMKEKYRSQLPLFRLYFKNLATRCETVRKIMSKREVCLDRTDWVASGVPVFENPWPYTLVEPKTDSETTRNRFSGILDSIVKGCNSFINCCDQVLRETGDDAKYLETSAGSIRDYKNMHNIEPFMPISSMLYILRNSTTANVNDFYPIHSFGTDQFKYQYGIRLILSQPHVAFTSDHIPGYKQLIESYNSLLDTRSYVDTKRSDNYAKTLIRTLRYIFETKHIKGNLSNDINSLPTFGINTQYNTRYQLTQNSFIKSDMVFDTVKYNNNDIRTIINSLDNITSIKYIITNNPKLPLSIINTVSVMPRLNELGKNDIANKVSQQRLIPTYSITHSLGEVISITDSGSREDKIKDIIKYITGESDTKRSLAVQNIIDLNIIPINVHALMREVPLANIYNYAYTFDRLIIELYYGLQNANARKLMSELCKDVYDNGPNSALSAVKSAKDMLVALLIRPYIKVHGDNPEYYELCKDMLSGVSSNELGRPKFLSDQIYNKSIFGELYEDKSTYSEQGPGSGREQYKIITKTFYVTLAHGLIIEQEKIQLGRPLNLNEETPIMKYVTDFYKNGKGTTTGAYVGYNPMLKSLQNKFKLGTVYKDTDLNSFANVYLNGNSSLYVTARLRSTGVGSRPSLNTGGSNVLHYLDTVDKQDYNAYGATLQPDNENVLDSDQIKTVDLDYQTKALLVTVGKLRFNTVFIRNLVFIVNLYRSVRLKLQRDLVYNREVIAKSSSITDPNITEFKSNSVYRPRRAYGRDNMPNSRNNDSMYERYRY
jgi:hypothetical protein